jgi:starvation-inducible DNA-binding protein
MVVATIYGLTNRKEDAWPQYRPHTSSMCHSAAMNGLWPASFSGRSWTSSTWPRIGKQAHWNVEGRQLRSVHRERDELVDARRTLGDEVAERAVTIGAAPDGQAETIAGSTEIEPLPPGVVGDQAVTDAIATRLAGVTARARRRIERTAGVDAASEDLMIRNAGSLEKQLW